jgi:hypothetical protein
LPFQPILESASHDAEDRRSPGVENQVRARVGQRLLHVRRLAAQIPRHDPKVLDIALQIRRGLEAREAEFLRCQRGIEHTLGLRPDFLPAIGLLSGIFKALARGGAIVRRAWLFFGR